MNNQTPAERSVFSSLSESVADLSLTQPKRLHKELLVWDPRQGEAQNLADESSDQREEASLDWTWLSSSSHKFPVFPPPALDPVSAHRLLFSLSLPPPAQVHLQAQLEASVGLPETYCVAGTSLSFPIWFFLVSKIKQSPKSKHHRLTSQPKAEEKCLMLSFLAPNRIYEHFLCFHFFPQSLLFLTPQS